MCVCVCGLLYLTDPTGYAWEGTLERSWDAIEEDETGKLKINMAVAKQQRQRCVFLSISTTPPRYYIRS